MRIVIDMQGAQTESRYRGIGRYTMAFAQAVVRNRGENEILLALNGLFPDTIEPIRAAFDGLLPQENIRVWYAPGPVNDADPSNSARREVAELVREAFLASLCPDIIHVSSLFEGYIDDAVTSIGRFDERTPVSVILYDLIPLINPDQYLAPNPSFAAYYERKLDSLNNAQGLLAISEYTRQEGLDYLGIDAERIINVSTAVGSEFRTIEIDEVTRNALTRKLGLSRPFVLYSGGCDERKNLLRLIEAWSNLPYEIRQAHHLLFAGRMPEGSVAELRRIAKSHGLKDNELLFSDYVSDDELVQLYNLCKLFVFPSWHEGFGLPALEAMACGAPVIGANTTSLPEVIGLKNALFDPFDVNAIRDKIQRALTDETYPADLRAHGLAQAKRFSWDKTARRAIAAWERQAAQHTTAKDGRPSAQADQHKLVEAVASRMSDANEKALIYLAAHIAQNERAGIERQLLLDISELHQRDSATGVQRVVRSYLHHLLHNPPRGFRVLPVYATLTEGYRYATVYTARLLGQHQPHRTDAPIRWQRGDIFFGLDMQHHVQLAHASTFARMRQGGVVVKFLVYDLLPIQLADFFKDGNAKALHEQWLSMIAAQDEAICISKATADAYEAWIRTNGIATAPGFCTDWVHMGADLEGSKPSRGLPPDASDTLRVLESRPTFLAVSTLEPRKAQSQILDAVEALWSACEDINLVLVGHQGWKIDALVDRIARHPENGKRLFWLKGISDEYLERVYQASTCLVAASINEGFGLPLIEAARHAIPVIARDIPVFREVAGDSAFYFSGDTGDQLAQAMVGWLRAYRKSAAPQSTGIRWLTWEQSTEQLKGALIDRHYPRRQLLVDVSELVQRDARTGIQRVVRSVLREWLENPPIGYRVEPVYASVTEPYRYARRLTARFMGHAVDSVTDESIDRAPGDVFFVLDLQPNVQVANADFYQHLRQQGVTVKFTVYDLLCVLQEEHFPPGAAEGFTNWLKVVAENDGAVCISKSVANELSLWMGEQKWNRLRHFQIDSNPLGADVVSTAPTSGLPDDARDVLRTLRQRPSFLMVGTLEPRKGHKQVLDTFECLWQSGTDANLVIVGKQGWMVESLVERLRSHQELGNRLFWLEGISDEYLEKAYAAGTCLIAASYGEGFGLPLIEAAQHKLPIIARDIPVFREVAGDHAFYFNAGNAGELADAVIRWLALYQEGQHPKSEEMPWLTWKESSQQLLASLGLDKSAVVSQPKRICEVRA